MNEMAPEGNPLLGETSLTRRQRFTGRLGLLRRPRLALCFRFRRKEVALRGAGPEGGRGRQTVSLLLAGEPDGGSAFPAT